MSSNATDGGNWLGSCPFAIPLTATSAPAGGTAIAVGSYKLTTDVETYVVVGTGTLTAPDISGITAQSGTPNAAFHIQAGGSDILEVAEAGMKIAARSKSGTGTLHISGPIRKAAIS